MAIEYMPENGGRTKPRGEASASPPPKKKSPAKPKASKSSDADHIQWFLGLSTDDFIDLCQQWNEHAHQLEIPKHDDYDEWLNYFKTLPPSTIQSLHETGRDFLSTEAFAALSMWRDIVDNPQRITKIHKSGLKRKEKTKSIVELARSGSLLETLYGVRDKIAEQLDIGSGKDVAALTKQLAEVTDQIAELERKQGPKKGTKLDKLMVEVKKRSGYNGNGARNTSFKSRIVKSATIDDVES